MLHLLPSGLAVAGVALLSAAPAPAHSIAFLRGGELRVASPDGSRRVQVTRSVALRITGAGAARTIVLDR